MVRAAADFAKKVAISLMVIAIASTSAAAEDGEASDDGGASAGAEMADGEAAAAASKSDETFGGWFFAEVNHDFDCGLSLTGYIEHDNYSFKRLECNYGRFSVGYKILPWLRIGVNYVPVYEPGKWLHFGEAEVMGTLKSGDFKVSIRERYRHGFTNGKNELRSRLKVAYSVPNSKLGFYLAPEVFTWGVEWKKTRHYVACTYNVLDYMQIEGYYLYYAFNGVPAQHVIGLGLNFDL